MRHLKEEKYANEERKLQVKEGPLVGLVAQRFSAVFRVVFASQAAEKERAEEVEVASFALVAEKMRSGNGEWARKGRSEFSTGFSFSYSTFS